MTHRILVNSHTKPMQHPISGQVIMPGQPYAEPMDLEQVDLVDPADPGVLVQSIADPKATKKALTAAKRNSSGNAQ